MVEPDAKELIRLEDEIFQAACVLMMHDPSGAFRVMRAVSQAQECLLIGPQGSADPDCNTSIKIPVDPIPAGDEPAPDGAILH